MPTPNGPAAPLDAAFAAGPATPPGATEAVERPEPGLGRGQWEAPAWVFYAVVVAALVGGLAWLLSLARSRKALR